MSQTIILKFISAPALDSVLILGGNSLTFKNIRTNIGECTISNVNIIQRDNYYNSFNADYNFSGIFTFVKISSNEISITHPSNSYFTTSNILNTTNGAIEVTGLLLDDTLNGDFTIDIVDFVQADSDPCNNVKAVITTSLQADRIESPIEQNVNTNPYNFDIPRGVALRLKTSLGDQFSDFNITGNAIATCSLGASGVVNVVSGNVIVKNVFSNILGSVTGVDFLINNTNLSPGNEILLPVGSYPFSSNSISCDISNTGSSYLLARPENGVYQSARGIYEVPSILSADNFTIDITVTISGSSLNVIPENNIGLDLQYSIDNINYQTSTLFNNIVEGNYTLYIKDQLGCSVEKSFVIEGKAVREPYIHMSRALSLSFIKQVVHDNYSIFKNDENTFSKDLDYVNSICDPHLLINKDIIKIQFKSNFSEHTAFLRKEDFSENELTIIKKTSNLNRYEMLDVVYYSYSDNEVGLYFNSGSSYDINGVVNGTFTLNGNLPDMAIIGNEIEIAGLGLFTIKDTFYDENINKHIIVIDYVYSGLPTITTVRSIYDLLPFEVYEFEIDFNLYGNGLYDVLINFIDPNYDDIFYLSENISVEDDWENTIAIRYFNDKENNKDIFYKYGIEHFLRVPLNYKVKSPSSSTKITVNDNDASIINSTINDGDKVSVGFLPESFAFKCFIAFSCDNLYLNNVKYIKNSDPDMKNEKGTNMYFTECSLIKTGKNYNNNKKGYSGVDEGYIELNIPQILTDGINFLKIK